MKKAIIIGATSGIGQEVAGILVQQGWRIGIAGRREEVLRSMQQANPQQIEIQHLDVTKENAVLHLTELIDRLGGMDLFFLSSGVGFQNRNLEPEIRTEYRTYQCRRLYPNGNRSFRLFQKDKKRTYRCNQFHSRYQGIGSRTCLLRHQTVSEYIHRCFGTTRTDAAS